jgi:hypothetical protein
MLTCTGSGGSTAKTASISITADTTPGTGFKIGDRIQTKNNVNVRTEGLISSATLIGVNPTGSIGTIKEGPTVSTDIYGTVTWFKIDFDAGFDGWVGADNYTLVTSVPPTLTFTASASSVASGGNATLTWSSTGATLCTAGGSWSGTKATSGSESTGSLTTVGSKMFTLYCTGAGGSITKNVTIEVTSGSGTGTTTVSTRVMANTNVNVRQTPGGLKIGLQYMGATGTQGTQAPVTAKNNTWVYVDFDSGIDGYVAQQYLTVIKTQTSSDVQAQIDNLMKQLAVLQALLAQLQALEQ